MTLDERFNFGLMLIREAGDLALGYFNNRNKLTIQNKGPQDLASEADLNAELLIREKLAKAFPQDAFLGEETPLRFVDAAKPSFFKRMFGGK